MPCIITSVHDPVALAATCRRLGLSPPENGCAQLGPMEACGWVVRLNGLDAPLVFDTLTGLVAYHPRDNGFVPYGRIMRFILRYYDIRAALRRGESSVAWRSKLHSRRRRVMAREVA
jgi:hypothetical protein